MHSFPGRVRDRAFGAAILVASAALLAPSTAAACSRDDTAWFETFVDTSCLVAPLSSTTLDALGGLRLVTNGAPVTTAWETDTHFADGVTWETSTFAPVGVRTLDTSGSGDGAELMLPATLVPLDRGAGQDVLGPSQPVVGDGDGIGDPAVVKAGAGYRMWYAGTAENGGSTAIFEATSANGSTWTRANGGLPVLQATGGAFDAHGVSAPHVVYDPADPSAPYRMWYAGQGTVYGAIGLATSADGVTWTKYDDAATAAAADPVLTHGQAGAADSFSAGDPTVLKDGATWKLWYTGDDSSKKRIAYATSLDGVHWTKGGKVIAPEDPGANANYSFGAFAPSVFKTAPNAYRMLLTGRKLVSGSTFQTKIMDASSSDGITWSAPSPAVNPAGNSSKFDYSNLDAPHVVADPGAGSSSFKLYYAGNTVDANGNFHTRIGYATSSDGNSFGKVAGAQPGGSVLDVGAAATPFDARSASGLSVAAAPGSTPAMVGFYDGLRGSDFKRRLGLATSASGATWSKVAGAGADGSLFALGGSFDQNGQRDPSVLYDENSGLGTDDWFLFFTGEGASATSIGRAGAPQDAGTKLPDNGAWSARSQVLAGSGSGFDASAVAHPSIVKDGTTAFLLYYVATDGSGARSIGRVSSIGVTGPYIGRTQVLASGAPGSFDAGGVKDPVVTKAGAADYRMLYTGIEPLPGGDTVERIGYATSTDGLAWTKRGVVLSPSRDPFAADERAVRPAGMLVDGSVLHVWATGIDRTGRGRALHLTTAFPTPVAPAAGVPGGDATYQLGGATTTVRDFRRITRTSTGTGITIWMSFLQPYSSSGSEFWSDWFPVTSDTASEDLHFLLTVRGVRWQARLKEAAGDPRLDAVEIEHAPVSFAGSGEATTTPIQPPDGQQTTAWGTLTAHTTTLQGGSASAAGTLWVLDAASSALLTSAALNTSGDTTVNLAGISVAEHPALRARLQLSGDGGATPLVQSLKVLFNAAAAPPSPPPPPPPIYTLSASRLKVVFGQVVTLGGVVTQSGRPLAGSPVGLLAQPTGSVVAAGVATTVSDAAGAYRATVTPSARTIYSVAGASATPAVVVEVAPKVTLTARRKGTRGSFTGKVAPGWPKRPVTIQRRLGSKWVTYAKLTTSATSTFGLRKRGLSPKRKYRFRAVTAARPELLAGTSAEALVDAMKVTLKAAARGRRVTFTGTVRPRHRGTAVTIEELRGTRWARVASGRLTARSAFRITTSLKAGTHVLRARTREDRDHFGGTSPQRTVTLR